MTLFTEKIDKNVNGCYNKFLHVIERLWQI